MVDATGTCHASSLFAPIQVEHRFSKMLGIGRGVDHTWNDNERGIGQSGALIVSQDTFGQRPIEISAPRQEHVAIRRCC